LIRRSSTLYYIYNKFSFTTFVYVFGMYRGSDSGLYQLPPISRALINKSYVSEDQLSLTLPRGCCGSRESDQLSVSSSSSVGGPSPRERRYLPSDLSTSGIYLPMAPLPSSQYSPASSSKVSVRTSFSYLILFYISAFSCLFLFYFDYIFSDYYIIIYIYCYQFVILFIHIDFSNGN
jgi:hypothetical protein